ncbi:heavy metal sensor histidine kinase [bacterium]|nr:heavy metal sensor histidine kinase [bacterium]
MSLRLRLVLWYSAVFGLSGGLLILALYAFIAHRYYSDADEELLGEHQEMACLTLRYLDDMDRLREVIAEEIGLGAGVPLTYHLVDTAKRKTVLFVAGDPRHNIVRDVVQIQAPPLHDRIESVLPEGRRYAYRVVTGPLHAKLHPHLVLQAGMYTKRIVKRLAALRKYMFITLLAVLAVAGAGGWFLSSRSLKPIDALAQELSHVESSRLGERLGVGAAGDEIDRLRQAINRMLERLERAFTTLQSFTADAAHELRTPLSALQCRIEVAINRQHPEEDPRDVLRDVLNEATQVSTLVASLLLLARMDSRSEVPDPQAVDLAALASDVCEPFALLAEHKGVQLSLKHRGDATCHGDPVLLRRLVGNLLDNALRHTPEGGSVDVGVVGDRTGCQVTVEDTGVGIAPAALERIFERFYRVDESRSRAEGGTGLGLSIVQRVVQLHGGRINVASEEGRGTTFHVWLPRADPTA